MALSPGAFAGIAVVCAVVGVVIGVFLQRGYAWVARGRLSQDEHCLSVAGGIEAIIRPNKSWDPKYQLDQLHDEVDEYVYYFLTDNRVPGPYDSATFARIAGSNGPDWDRLADMEPRAQQSALTYFILRFLYARMTPDGDVDSTLLPADLLSIYQRLLTKEFHHYRTGHVGHPDATKERVAGYLLHYWRALTVFWGSEPYFYVHNRDLVRNNYWSIEYQRRWENELEAEDPRMPRVLALEKELKSLLVPFYGKHWFHLQAYEHSQIEGGLDSVLAQKALRRITSQAADIALVSFAQPAPIEFFWPEEYRRPGSDPNSNDGLLQCFGMRQLENVPWLFKSPKAHQFKMKIICDPMYSDTHKLRDERIHRMHGLIP